MAIKTHVLDRNGVLHTEPERLLVDDMRSMTQAHSVLSLIGQGCHRISEIAARLEKPAGSLSRIIAQLIELDYIAREIPFGVNPKSNKKTLYKLADPFLLFWYRFVYPNKSLLEIDLTDAVYRQIEPLFSQHVSVVWEELARQSVPKITIDNIAWGRAYRWWGSGNNKESMEFDIVAESLDRQSLLVGEVKWSDTVDVAGELRKLQLNVHHSPFRKHRSIHFALWVRNPVQAVNEQVSIILPEDVLKVLR